MLRESLIAMLLIAGIESAEPKQQTKVIGSIESIVKSKPSPLEKKVAKIRSQYLQERKFEKEDYYDALYTWRYFDWDKAEKIAYGLIQSSAIRKNDKEKELFIRSCRKYPFIKAYCTKKNIDPRLVWWVFLTESHLKYITGDHGEIGDPQVMPDVIDKYWGTWSKDPYCIEGKGPEDPINIYMCGMKHLESALDNAGCTGISLNKLKAKQLLSIYAQYARDKKRFDANDEAQYNFEAEAKMHFYLFDLIDKYSSKGSLMSEKGRKILGKRDGKVALMQAENVRP